MHARLGSLLVRGDDTASAQLLLELLRQLHNSGVAGLQSGNLPLRRAHAVRRFHQKFARLLDLVRHLQSGSDESGVSLSLSRGVREAGRRGRRLGSRGAGRFARLAGEGARGEVETLPRQGRLQRLHQPFHLSYVLYRRRYLLLYYLDILPRYVASPPLLARYLIRYDMSLNSYVGSS